MDPLEDGVRMHPIFVLELAKNRLFTCGHGGMPHKVTRLTLLTSAPRF